VSKIGGLAVSVTDDGLIMMDFRGRTIRFVAMEVENAREVAALLLKAADDAERRAKLAIFQRRERPQ
jgi:hypothetical protein